MKKKGFTLVELLAVIVILAIIALIAIPKIVGIVEDARKGAAKSGSLGYIDAIEKQIARNLIDSDSINDIEDNIYSIEGLDNKNIKVKGEKPSEGCISILNGRVSDYSLKIGNYVVSKKANKQDIIKNGQLRECSIDGTEMKSYSIGDKVTINETEWFVLEASSEKEKTVKLISKCNINANAKSSTIAANLFTTKQSDYALPFDTNSSNIYANSSIKRKLEQDFKPLIENILGITVDNIRMWNYNDLKNLGCSVTWNSSSNPEGVSSISCSNSSYFSTIINIGAYTWIDAPYATVPYLIWEIYDSGIISNDGVGYKDTFGVRPVITISKSQIS